jgi:pilus assembly protein CpaB
MKSRGLVVAIAVVLAVLAAVGVIVYTSSVRDNAIVENTTPVIASSQDIPAGTELDSLIAANVFKTINVPDADLVPGAVTDITQLQGKTSSAPIFQNEQIPEARIGVGGINNLGIGEGNVGLGLQVEGSGAVNGYIQTGDHVALYATFAAGTVVTRENLRFYLTGAQINRLLQSVGGGTTTNPSVIVMPTDFTFTLVPAIKVLAVQNPETDPSTGRAASGASTFVLDLSPTDATNVVFAIGHATLYMGLLPPGNDTGYDEPGTIGAPYGRVVGVAK